MTQYKCTEIIFRNGIHKAIEHGMHNTELQAKCCTLFYHETTEAKAVSFNHSVITKYENGQKSEIKFYI